MKQKQDIDRAVQLKRRITLPHLILYGTGSMIGAGIYVLIGVIAGYAHYYTPFVFIVAGIIGLFTALSYAELATKFPQSAGAALYVHHAFKHNFTSKLVGYLVILTGIVSCAALARGFAGYAAELIPVNYSVLVLSIVLCLMLIASWRIHLSMWLISIISLIEIFGLIFVMYILLPNFDFARISEKMFTFPSYIEFLTIANTALIAFYAFIGFEDMVNVVEEVKNNQKVMSQGIIYAFIFTMIIYFLVSLVTIASVDLNTLTKVQAPFAKMLSQHSNWASKLISVISVIATLNGALIQIIMASRVFYGMAKKDIGFKLFAKVNAITHTPINAVFFTSLLILGFAYFLPIEQLAKLTSFIILIIFSMVNLSLIILISRKDIVKKHWCSQLLPLIALILNIILLLSQLYFEITR